MPFVAVAQLPTDIGLNVEGQRFLSPAGGVVERATDRPQEVLGATEAPQFLRGQDTQGNQTADIADVVNVLGDPEQRVEVAQATLAVLDVGLDQIA